jgi:hypothetical protein
MKSFALCSAQRPPSSRWATCWSKAARAAELVSRQHPNRGELPGLNGIPFPRVVATASATVRGRHLPGLTSCSQGAGRVRWTSSWLLRERQVSVSVKSPLCFFAAGDRATRAVCAVAFGDFPDSIRSWASVVENPEFDQTKCSLAAHCYSPALWPAASFMTAELHHQP